MGEGEEREGRSSSAFLPARRRGEKEEDFRLALGREKKTKEKNSHRRRSAASPINQLSLSSSVGRTDTPPPRESLPKVLCPKGGKKRERESCLRGMSRKPTNER